jgi:hypothetical protein
MTYRFPEKFSDLYTSKVQPTGQKLYRVDPKYYTGTNIDPLEAQKGHEIDEIQILMPQPEYERFSKDWNNYVDILLACDRNPILKQELEKLIILVHLYK